MIHFLTRAQVVDLLMFPPSTSHLCWGPFVLTVSPSMRGVTDKCFQHHPHEMNDECVSRYEYGDDVSTPPPSSSKFLNKLLAPIFMKIVRKMTYINGYDLIRALANYASERCFVAAKLVVTSDVSDLEGIDAILSARFTSWSTWRPIDQ
jgi:hypothetical protein